MVETLEFMDDDIEKCAFKDEIQEDLQYPECLNCNGFDIKCRNYFTIPYLNGGRE